MPPNAAPRATLTLWAEVLCKSPQTLPNSPRAAHRSIFANFSHHTRVWSSRTLTIRSYSERMASVCSSSPSYCIYSESFRAVKNTPSEHTPPRSIRPLTTRLRAYAPGPYAPGPYAHTPIRPYAHTPIRPYAHTPMDHTPIRPYAHGRMVPAYTMYTRGKGSSENRS